MPVKRIADRSEKKQHPLRSQGRDSDPPFPEGRRHRPVLPRRRAPCPPQVTGVTIILRAHRSGTAFLRLTSPKPGPYTERAVLTPMTEKKPPYRNPVPTVDIIIEIGQEGGEPAIVLIERKNPPPGWA